MNHTHKWKQTNIHKYIHIFIYTHTQRHAKNISRYTFTHTQRKNNYKLNPKPLQHTHTHNTSNIKSK